MTIEIIDENQIKLYLNEGSADTVTLSGAQTLTNKTINAADNTIIGLQPLDADLTAIAALTGTAGLLKKTAANTWVLDTTSYLTSSAIGSTVQAYAANLTSWAALAPSSKVDATGGTASGLTLNDGYTEEVFTVTGTAPALSPTNGTYQTWSLTANSTPTAGTWSDGQSMTLHIDDGSAYTITWASLSVTWKTNAGVAPTLQTSGVTVIQLWKTGGVIYGARVGDA